MAQESSIEPSTALTYILDDLWRSRSPVVVSLVDLQ